MTLDEYRHAVSIRMLTVYAIDWTDACGEDELLQSALDDGWSAEEFVDWFGRKYDLEPLWVFGLDPPFERIAKLNETKPDSSSD